MSNEPIDTREKLRELRHNVFMQKVREERRIQKRTQGSVGERVGLGRFNVSDVENGRSRDLLSVWDVVDGTGVSLSVIIARTEREVAERLREQGRKLEDFIAEPADD